MQISRAEWDHGAESGENCLSGSTSSISGPEGYASNAGAIYKGRKTAIAPWRSLAVSSARRRNTDTQARAGRTGAGFSLCAENEYSGR